MPGMPARALCSGQWRALTGACGQSHARALVAPCGRWAELGRVDGEIAGRGRRGQREAGPSSSAGLFALPRFPIFPAPQTARENSRSSHA